MKEVSYFAPTEVGEAAKLLAEYGDKAAILAGGTDLVAQLNYYEVKPAALLYIGGLGLDYVREKGGKLVIGAGTTTAHLLASDLVAQKFPVLAAAAATHGSPAVRTVATIGGNLGTASPRQWPRVTRLTTSAPQPGTARKPGRHSLAEL